MSDDKIANLNNGNIDATAGGAANSLQDNGSRNKIQVLKGTSSLAKDIAKGLAHGEFALGKLDGYGYDLWIGGTGEEAAKVVLAHEFNTAINGLKTELDGILEEQLKDAIDAEAATRASADATLQANIDAEAATRASDDATLQSNIDTEAATRASADSTLQANIDAEAATRASADDALAARATTLETKTQNITSSGANSTTIAGAIQAGSLTVGDLTVTGSNTVVDSTTVRTEDNIIELNYDADGTGGAGAGEGGVLIHGRDGSNQSDGLIKWTGTDLSFLGGGEVDSNGSLVSGTQKSLLNITENEFSLSDGKVSYTANEFKVNGLTVKADGTVVATEFDGNVDGGNF